MGRRDRQVQRPPGRPPNVDRKEREMDHPDTDDGSDGLPAFTPRGFIKNYQDTEGQGAMSDWDDGDLPTHKTGEGPGERDE